MREQNRDHQKRFFSVCIERSRPSPTLRPPPPSPAPQPPSPFPSCAESSLSSSSNSSSWSRRRYGASRESSGGSRAGGPGRPPASEASSSAAENSDGERGRRFRRQDHRHRSRSRSRTGSRSRAGSRAGSQPESRAASTSASSNPSPRLAPANAPPPAELGEARQRVSHEDPSHASHTRTHSAPPLLQHHIWSQMPTDVCLLFVVRAAAARLLRSVAAPMHLLRLPIRLRLPRISPLRLGVSRWGWGVGRLSLRADHGGRAPACRFHSSFQVL